MQTRSSLSQDLSLRVNRVDRLEAVLAEIKRRHAVLPTFIDPSFPLQERLITQPMRFQGWKATRRAAKSNSFARRMLKRLTQKKCNALYLALTLDSAKAILWDVVDDLLTQNKIGFSPNKQAGTFTLENGSFIKFAGIDSNYKEMRKILGQKFAIVGIDECGSMTQDMEVVINQMIAPALTDEMGDLILLGTAETIPNTYFQKVMDGIIPGWHLEIWDTYQNPYMAANWDAEINRILTANPLSEHASWFRAHYRNEWAVDDDLRIYRISPINYIDRMPVKKDPTYLVGVDLGFNDDCSFVVGCYFRHDPTLYVVKSFKAPGMDITDTANAIKSLLLDYGDALLVVDGANKQGVEEMRKRHGLPLKVAQKDDKFTFMRMLRDDFIQNRVQIVEQDNKQMIDELLSLLKLKDIDQEDPRCQNHLTDAMLYMWREARTYTEEPEVTEWKSADQKMKDLELKEAEEMRERIQEMNWIRF